MTPLTDDDKRWLDTHRGADPRNLYLKHHGDTHLTWLTCQLECRLKAAGKLTGWPISDDFIYPDTLAVEQCTGTDLAELHSRLISPGERVLDMTCGLAIDALHLCRRAATVTTFDLKSPNVEAARINAANANISNLHAICGDSVHHITEDHDAHYDTIFADPARRDTNGKRVYAISDCSPDILSLMPAIARRTGRLIVKCSPMIDITHTVNQIRAAAPPCAVGVYIYGSSHECKEVVAVIDFRNQRSDVEIHCVTPGKADFSFSKTEEEYAPVAYATPTTGQYIIEPYPTIMKAGAFRLFAGRHGLHKISPSTHLYTSPTPIDGLQARCSLIETVIPFDKRGIKAVSARYPRINVATRNFIMSADELRKRLKVSDGSGTHKLWGTTAYDGSRILIIGSTA